MADFQPPPTWANPVIVDKQTGESKFNPVWLKWFVDLVAVINASGGGAGAVQHNSTGGLQGGTANQYFHLTTAQHTLLTTSAVGTWTPVLNNVTNIAASTAYQSQYIRLGASVAFSGRVDVDPTGVGACALGISLPVASNFGAVEDLAGAGFSPAVAGFGTALLADVANDRAAMQWVATDTANRAVYFSGLYQVI